MSGPENSMYELPENSIIPEYKIPVVRPSQRTATIQRRKPLAYSQVLLSNNRWRTEPLDPVATALRAHQYPYTYGANFNTNFNTEFSRLPNERRMSPEIEHLPEKNGQERERTSFAPIGTTKAATTIPRMTERKLPYRILYRVRQPGCHRAGGKFRHGVNMEYMPPSNLVRLFGESSVPGVRDIALSQSFLRRIFWICSFFFFGFLALRDISQLVSEYYTYPITVNVRLRDSRRLQFPAVTMCNMNIVRYSALCITNASVIKDSMIPRDLREKLCGLQPTVTLPPTPSPSTVPVLTTTTTTKPSSSSPRETTDAGTLNPKNRTVPSGGGGGGGGGPKKKTITATTAMRVKSSTLSTTPASSNDANEGLDDINNYGVISNSTELNDTSSSGSVTTGTPDPDLNGTESSSISTVSTTTVSKPIDDIPSDIAAPIEEIAVPRTKRKIQTKTKNANFTGQDQDANLTSSSNSFGFNPLEMQSPTKSSANRNNKESNKEPLPFSDIGDIELTEREEKELQENLTNWLAVIYNSNEKIAKQLGHQFEDFVLRCTIRSTNCTHATSFEQFFTPTEGNCFTFKSQNLRKTNLDRIKDETSIAGVNYGLELVLNLEISEYLTGTAQIGAIIMVQHPDEIGNSASEAIFVAPQQSTYIGMKMVNISRLPKPYPEECIDHWPAALIGRLTQNASYSQQACLKICLQRTIHTRCNCQSAQLPQLELNSTLKICDTRRKVTRNCVEEVMFQAEEKVSTCKCPPRCQVINYEKTVSMTKWPTREDKVTFDRGKTNLNFQNLAKVTVYFQTMTCQEVLQEKAYTTAKLFSSLGGILGMYVGFSFLSLFEILEIFVRRFWYIVTKKNNRFRSAVHAITATFAMSRNKKRPAQPTTKGNL